MNDGYEPTSEFLRAVAANNAPLSGGPWADANLHRLIQMTRDEDRTNRDWATFLLALEDLDTPDVRDALMQAASDEDDFVRAEAVHGLARRDPTVALPFVQAELRADSVTVPILEAAALCAHPSLIDDLRDLTETSDSPYLDKLTADALQACETGTPPL
jgi:HEAT repeat protein